MTLPPETTQPQRISAARARNHATANGWVPPLELDDDVAGEISNEDLGDVDEVAIQRRMSGDRAVRLSTAESVELVRRWKRSGRPLAECERVTGLKPERYYDTTAQEVPA